MPKSERPHVRLNARRRECRFLFFSFVSGGFYCIGIAILCLPLIAVKESIFVTVTPSSQMILARVRFSPYRVCPRSKMSSHEDIVIPFEPTPPSPSRNEADEVKSSAFMNEGFQY